MRIRAFVLTVTVLAVAAPVAADTVRGVLQAVDVGRVTLAGQSYAIEAGSELTSLGGDRIQASELRPGTEVEMDLDESGHLVVLRAAVIR